MKNKFIILIGSLLIIACKNSQEKTTKEVSAKDSSMEMTANESPQSDSGDFKVNIPEDWPVKFSDYGFDAVTYPQAESYTFMNNFIKRSGVNNIYHFKTLAKAADHWVVSPNLDVLYSMVTVDATDDFTLVLPKTKDDRFMSYQIVDANHYTPIQAYGSGDHFFPKGTFNTPHVAIGIRVIVDPTDPKDIAYVANEVQPKMKIIAKSNANHIPKIDTEKMIELRKALLPYYNKLPNTFGGMTKNASEVTDLWFRELCTAGAWGLSEDQYAMYRPYSQKLEPGKCYKATYKVPPHDAFWSITMYDKDNYLISDDHSTLGKYNTKFNDDGTFTVYFGSEEDCGDVPNRLNVVEGWSFLMRAYKPNVQGFKDYQMPTLELVEK